MINLKELDKRLDNSLKNESKFGLTMWILKKRKIYNIFLTLIYIISLLFISFVIFNTTK
jgi:hypothetical protein